MMEKQALTAKVHAQVFLCKVLCYAMLFKMLIIIVLILYIPQRTEVSDTYVCQICLFC